MKNLKYFGEFVNENYNQSLNEGLFGKLFDWAGGILKLGKVKKALETYEKELIGNIQVDMTDENEDKMGIFAKILKKEFEIEIAKKNKQNTEEFKKQLNLLKEEEKNIKEFLDNEISQAIKKKPNIKYKATKLKLEMNKKGMEAKRKILEKFQKDEKYKGISSISAKLKDIKNIENKMNSELAKIDNISKGYQPGDVVKYKSKDGGENIILITKVENDDRGEIKDIMAKTLKEGDGELRTEKEMQEKDSFTPIRNNIGEKITDEKELSDLFGGEEGSLDKYKEYKEKNIIKSKD